jgi:hypothetical protein
MAGKELWHLQDEVIWLESQNKTKYLISFEASLVFFGGVTPPF